MENKERILQKAHELFNRYGIRSVSMDDIAVQLGMSKKTVYQFYEDKDELVNEVFSAIMDRNKAQCTDCRCKGENVIHEVFLSFDMVQEMLTNMNPAVLFDMQKYHPSAFKKFQDYRNQFLYKLIRENLEHGVKEGLYREDFDVEVLTRYRLHSIMLAFDPEVFPNNRSNLVHIEQQIMEHFLYGIATTKGQKLIQKYKNQRTKKENK
jgi:TetR/AcrR family transcriptional regulator, cholesterol catabolism regulator